MKKFIKFVKAKISDVKKSVKKRITEFKNQVNSVVSYLQFAGHRCLAGTKAEAYVDTGVKILIAVVIGALVLGGIYTLFDSTILPTVTKKVTDLFNYKG